MISIHELLFIVSVTLNVLLILKVFSLANVIFKYKTAIDDLMKSVLNQLKEEAHHEHGNDRLGKV